MSRAVRYLRVGFSVMWGVLCVLLAVMWVRSYWVADAVTYIHSVKRLVNTYSAWGRCLITVRPQSWADLSSAQYSYDIDSQSFVTLPNALLGFYFHQVPSEAVTTVVVPYWFATLLTGAVAAVASPWFHWRFSVRTLLVITAIVAVSLGSVVTTIR
jgi:hypothetical protein